jgi:NAD(P)-dependent dehydrogenase (short-subunit alcohol dehydrogenase family)
MATIQELFDLTGKTAVVVGGAGLLGFRMSTALAQAGADVVIASRNMEKCQEKAAILDKAYNKAVAIQVDAGDYASVEALKQSVLDQFGKVDVLVCSMAAGIPGTPETLSVENWEKSIHFNLSAVWYMDQVFGKQMIEQGKGSIVNIASKYGIVAPPADLLYPAPEQRNPLPYGVAKAGVIQLTRYLATAWAKQGVKVNAISPGGYWLEDAYPDEWNEKYNRLVPDGRSGNDTDLNGAVVYLASDASAHVIGQNIQVDGGWTLW